MEHRLFKERKVLALGLVEIHGLPWQKGRVGHEPGSAEYVTGGRVQHKGMQYDKCPGGARKFLESPAPIDKGAERSGPDAFRVLKKIARYDLDRMRGDESSTALLKADN